MIGLIYLVTDTLTNYYKYQVFTTIKTYTEKRSEFPAVGFCDLNQHSSPNAVKIWNDMEKDLFYLNRNESKSDYDFFSQSSLDHKTTAEMYHNMLVALNSSDQIDRSTPIVQTVISCTYNFQKCNLTDFSWFYHDFYGKCFSFRTDQPVQRRGLLSGLHLEIFLRPSTDSDGFQARTKGLHIFVFNKSLLLPPSSGNDVAPGLQTSIQMARTFTKKLGMPYNQCNNIESALYNETIQRYNTYRQE